MVAGTVQEFIDYSLIIVTLMIIYYVFRFFMIEGPTKEEKKKAEAERIDAARDWIKGKWEGHKKAEETRVESEKKRREMIKRDHLLGGAKGFIIKAEQLTEDVPKILKTRSDHALHETKSALKKIEDFLNSAKKAIGVAKRASKDEKREALGKLYDYTEITEETLDKGVEKKLPKDDKDAAWDTKIGEAKAGLNKIRLECGHIIKSIDKFIDEDKLEVPTRTP